LPEECGETDAFSGSEAERIRLLAVSGLPFARAASPLPAEAGS
jgi:hypothetical protein